MKATCGGLFRNGPDKRFVRCDACGEVDYERNEGDKHHGGRSVFPRGAKVYVDGRTLVTVVDAFPRGSSSYAFPHYRLREGTETYVVSMDRVGVEKKKVHS